MKGHLPRLAHRKLLIAVLAAGPLAGSAAQADLPANTDVTLTAPSTTTGTVSILTLTFSAANNGVDLLQDPGSTLTLSNGGLIKNGAYISNLTGGILQSGTGELDVTTGGGDLIVGSAISGPATALVVDGTGTLQLTSTNAVNHTFAGGIYLNAGNLQISSDLNLGANAGNSNSITFNGGTLQTVNNDVTFGAARTLFVDTGGGTLNVQGGHMATINTVNQLQGTGSFVKDGSGTLLISAANSFNGPVTVNAGILQLHDTGALGGSSGTSSPITLNSGAQLNLRHDGPFPANFGSDITVAGNSTIDVNQIATGASGNIQVGALNIGTSTLTVQGANRSLEFTGTTTISGDATIANSIDVRLGGQVTGNGSLTKTGSGALTLSGFAPNTYTNTTKVLGGTLLLAKTTGANSIPGDLQLLGGTVQLITSGQIASTSNVSVTGGTLDVNSQTQSVSVLSNNGGTIMTGAGTLQVTNPGAAAQLAALKGQLRPFDSGSYTTVLQNGTTLVNAGGHFDNLSLEITGGNNIVQAGGTASVGAGGLAFAGATDTALLLNADTKTPGTLVLGGDVTFAQAAGTAHISNNGPVPIAGVVDLGGGQRSFVVNDGSAAVDMSVSATLTDGQLRKSGPGVLQLTSPNTYAGGTIISGGILEIDDPHALCTGPVSFAGGTLAFRSNGSSTIFPVPLTAPAANSITVDVSPLSSGSSGTVSVPSATLGAALNVTGSGGGNLQIAGPVTLQADVTLNNSADLVIGGVISGVASLSKTLTGTLTFSGNAANTYTGTTTVYDGTLVLGDTGGVAVPGDLTTDRSGTVRLDANEQIAPTATVTLLSVYGPATLDLNGHSQTLARLLDQNGGNVLLNGGTLVLGGTNQSFTFAGNISGGGSLVKNGTGTLTLSGPNTFTAGVSVNAGTLSFTSLAPGESSSGTLSGGLWHISDGATLNLSSPVTTNQATIWMTGPGSQFPQINGLTANAGSLVFGDGRSFTTAGAFSNTGTVTVGPGRPSAFTISGPVAQLNGSTLTGGSWNVSDNGALNLPAGASITTIGPQAAVGLGGTSSTFPALNSLGENDGKFTVGGGSGSNTFTTAAGLVNTGTLTVAPGGTLKIAGALSGNGSLGIGVPAGGPASLVVNSFSQSTINILTGGTLSVSHGTPGALNTVTLLTLSGGQLDLAQSTLQINYPAGLSPLSTVRTDLQSGYDSGKWDGPGIISSTADANHVLGYVDSSDHVLPGMAPNTLQVQYAQIGDTNLDGVVNLTDLLDLVRHFGQKNADWAMGDLNYDGTVNLSDFLLLARHFGQPIPPAILAQVSADLQNSNPASVPEPTAALPALAAAGLLIRRRTGAPQHV